MADVNYIFLVSLTIIVLGFVVKKAGIISEENGKIIAKLIINVTLPSLILYIISTIEIDPSLLLLPVICLGYSLIVVGIGWVLFKKAPTPIKGIILMTIIGFNIGLFAYPLIEGIYGSRGLQYIAMFDAANAFIIFGLCYSIAAIFSPKNEIEKINVNSQYIGKKLAKSIPLMSYIVALFVNLSGLQFPVIVMDLLEIISRANMALTLLLLGIYLNFKFEKSQWNTILKVLLMRYSFGLTIGLILFFTLPFDLLYRSIILVGLILPIGMAVVPFSVEFGYNEKVVGTIVNFSIIISFILMWLVILIVGTNV